MKCYFLTKKNEDLSNNMNSACTKLFNILLYFPRQGDGTSNETVMLNPYTCVIYTVNCGTSSTI